MAVELIKTHDNTSKMERNRMRLNSDSNRWLGAPFCYTHFYTQTNNKNIASIKK